MFAYEIWFVNGLVLADAGFPSYFEAECECLETIDDSDIGVDFWIVEEIK